MSAHFLFAGSWKGAGNAYRSMVKCWSSSLTMIRGRYGVRITTTSEQLYKSSRTNGFLA